jgi:hypothetical protein
MPQNPGINLDLMDKSVHKMIFFNFVNGTWNKKIIQILQTNPLGKFSIPSRTQTKMLWNITFKLKNQSIILKQIKAKHQHVQGCDGYR